MRISDGVSSPDPACETTLEDSPPGETDVFATHAHFANVVAAFFAACGQDLAQVAEAAMGITCIESRGPEGIYASVYLPDVPLGAIGGGTALDTQREALGMLGIEVDSDQPGAAVIRMAEILAATVLAGELSLMAAFTSRDLARAHAELARGGVPPEA